MIQLARSTKVDGRTARRADTKGAILSAATKLFVAKGMSATSVDDIAEAAQVAKGSIYYNFSSKNALVEALMNEYLVRTQSALTEAAGNLCGQARRRAILGALLRVIQQHPDAARLMVNEVFRTDRSWRDTAQAWRAVTMNMLTDDLENERPGQRQECSLIAAAMVGAALATAMEWLAFRPELDLETVQRQVFGTLGL